MFPHEIQSGIQAFNQESSLQNGRKNGVENRLSVVDNLKVDRATAVMFSTVLSAIMGLFDFLIAYYYPMATAAAFTTAINAIYGALILWLLTESGQPPNANSKSSAQ